jgi:hypothetical protein
MNVRRSLIVCVAAGTSLVLVPACGAGEPTPAEKCEGYREKVREARRHHEDGPTFQRDLWCERAKPWNQPVD